MRSKAGSKSAKGGKQNGGKSSGRKCESIENVEVENAQAEDEFNDLSVLRKPIEISVPGLSQAAKVYEKGTAEMQHLLAHECDIIYECKVCRNLFRSLANFISHKRAYCREQYCHTQHSFQNNYMVEDHNVIIQPEPIPANSPDQDENWRTSDEIPDDQISRSPEKQQLDSGIEASSSSSSSPQIKTTVPRIAEISKPKRDLSKVMVGTTNPKKDLSQVIEKLTMTKGEKIITETVGHISATKLYDSITENLATKKTVRKDQIIQLESMENTTLGVYQTIMQTTSSAVISESVDLMKTQVLELQDMMSRTEATLGPDGHISALRTATIDTGAAGMDLDRLSPPMVDGSSCLTEDHVCTICNTRFATRKTLNHHMKCLHVTYRTCFPCPCCKSYFSSNWSVYRHLYKVHRKTGEQVRKLRAQISRKVFKQEMLESEMLNLEPGKTCSAEPTAETPSEKQARLDRENQAWMENLEDDFELQMCGGCGRRFERRAALNSHSQICQKRIAARNNTKVRRISPSTKAASLTSNPSLVKMATAAAITAVDDITNSGVVTEKSCNSEQTDIQFEVSPMVTNDKAQVESLSPISVDTSHDNVFSSLSNPTTGTTRVRNTSGNWTEPSKKETPEKRIEIQIRRDYFKSGTSSPLAVGGIGTTSQGPESNNDVCVLGTGKKENAIDVGENTSLPSEEATANTECTKVMDDTDKLVGQEALPMADKAEGTLTGDEEYCLRMGNSEDDDYCLKIEENDDYCLKIEDSRDDCCVIMGYSNLDLEKQNSVAADENKILHKTIFQSGEEYNSENINDETQQKLTSHCSINHENESHNPSEITNSNNKNQEVISDTEVGEAGEITPEEPCQAHNKTKETAQVITSPTGRSNEPFSPLMESKMQSLINIRRLQCLPCHKKFNKLTNLRRHVAVHIGWSRYRCIVCSYKCFSKYDCVTHVIKVHLSNEERAKAHSMVQCIEIQDDVVANVTNSQTESNVPSVQELSEVGNVGNIASTSSKTEKSKNKISDEEACNVGTVMQTQLGNDLGDGLDKININHLKQDEIMSSTCNTNVIETNSKEESIDPCKSIQINETIIKKSHLKSNDSIGLVEQNINKFEALHEIQKYNNESSLLITRQKTKPIGNMIEMKDVSSDITNTSRQNNPGLQEEATSTNSSQLSLKRKHESSDDQVLIKQIVEQDVSKQSETTIDIDAVGISKPGVSNCETNAGAHKRLLSKKQSVALRSDSPEPNVDPEKLALHQMMLKVIFGSECIQSTDINYSKNACLHNGDHDSDSARYEELATLLKGSEKAVNLDENIKTSSNELSRINSENFSALKIAETVKPQEPVINKIQNHIGVRNKIFQSHSETNRVTERRARPVRNRVKVEKKDFIYDLSDKCLSPKVEESSRNVKRKHNEPISKTCLNVETDNSTCTPSVGKLMLVRTDVATYSAFNVNNSGHSLECSCRKTESKLANCIVSTCKSSNVLQASPSNKE